MTAPHLWEIEHPYRGPNCPTTDVPDVETLLDAVGDLDPDLNMVIRFDWYRWADPIHDTRFKVGDDRSTEELWVWLLRPDRPDAPLIAITCPVSAGDEPGVLEWLAGDRVLGPLKDMWAPLLGEHAYEAD